MTEKEQKVFQKRKKLNLKIKQDLQIWILIRIMGIVLLTISMASIILYFYSVTVVDAEYLRFAPNVRKVSEVLYPILLSSSLTTIIAGLLAALFLPQKIVGPIYRIEQDLLQIKSGDLTKIIYLRKGDILQDFSRSVNSAVYDIGNWINDIKKNNSDLEETITSGDLAEIKKVFEKQKQKLSKYTS